MTPLPSAARRYSRLREALAVLIPLAGWLFDAAMLLSGASARLAGFSRRVARRRPLSDALYTLLFRLRPTAAPSS